MLLHSCLINNPLLVTVACICKEKYTRWQTLYSQQAFFSATISMYSQMGGFSKVILAVMEHSGPGHFFPQTHVTSSELLTLSICFSTSMYMCVWWWGGGGGEEEVGRKGRKSGRHYINKGKYGMFYSHEIFLLTASM